MKIAILGNGKMGKRISELAKERNHEIIVKTDSKNPTKSANLSEVDVAIDFSTPDSAFENILHALKAGVPVISGTTGWLNRLPDVTKECNRLNGAFLHASNFSLGMNIFFELNKKLATLMKKGEYLRGIQEIHHKKKLDTPSGTAKKLRQDIDIIMQGNTEIESKRINEEFGTHIIEFISNEDIIEIKHEAKNRDGFAKGALLASEWILEKKGVFNLSDMIK